MVQFGLGVVRDLGPLGEVLTQEAVGVLVAAALPGTTRVTEIDRYASVDSEAGVRGGSELRTTNDGAIV